MNEGQFYCLCKNKQTKKDWFMHPACDGLQLNISDPGDLEQS